jgi:hypothetical protein
MKKGSDAGLRATSRARRSVRREPVPLQRAAAAHSPVGGQLQTVRTVRIQLTPRYYITVYISVYISVF